MIVSKKFRNKKTGEIVTQVPILDIANYEEVNDMGEKKKYIVDVSGYPFTYEVEAENDERAEEMAKDLFHIESEGRSVYNIEIVSKED